MALLMGFIALLVGVGMLVGVVAIVVSEPRILPAFVVLLWFLWRMSRPRRQDRAQAD